MKRTASAEKKSSVNAIWTDPARVKLMNTTDFAICIDNSQYPAALELHKLYRVIPDEDAARDGDLRIIDESGEDYLFPADYFIMVELPHSVVFALSKSFARAGQSAC